MWNETRKMELYEAIRGRRSIRKYLDKSVEYEKIAVVLEAGSHAPSSGDLRDFKFILVTKHELIQEIAQNSTEQYWIETAPVLIVVCAETGRNKEYYGDRGEKLYSIQNSAAATQNMLLQAYEQGLSSCWIGSFDEEKIRIIIKAPENVRPQAILTLGYADEEPKSKTEIDIETLVRFEQYGQNVKEMQRLTKDYSKEWEEYVKKANIKKDNWLEQLKKYFESFSKKKK